MPAPARVGHEDAKVGGDGPPAVQVDVGFSCRGKSGRWEKKAEEGECLLAGLAAAEVKEIERRWRRLLPRSHLNLRLRRGGEGGGGRRRGIR